MNHSYDSFSSRKEFQILPGIPEKGPDANSWAVPWSDLMMTMFILFAVLFVFASARRDLFREIQEGRKEASATIRQEVDKSPSYRGVHRATYRALQVEQHIELRPDAAEDILTKKMESPHLIAFSLDRPILFSHLSADLEAEAVTSLKAVLPVIRKSNLDVQVIGYTDGLPVHTPVFAGNWELALARAMTVAHWLMDEGRVSPLRITVSGRGANDPRVPNTSRSNRIQNRRVEILLTRNRQGT